MALAYLFDPNKQFQDRNGVNNVSGFLRVYYEGTDDRAKTYKNFIGTLNPADIPIDNDGRAVVIVDEEKTYRIEVYERNGNLQWTQHPVFPQGCGGSEYDGDVSNATATFTKDAGDPSEISSGSTLKVLFTKISKFFAGLKRVAFTGSYNDLSDKPDVKKGKLHRYSFGDGVVDGETPVYGSWLIDLDKPDPNGPEGYARVTPAEFWQSTAVNGEVPVYLQDKNTNNSLTYAYLSRTDVTKSGNTVTNVFAYFVRSGYGNVLSDSYGFRFTKLYNSDYLQRAAQTDDMFNALSRTGNGSKVTVDFTEAVARANIINGEKLSVLFGKIKKWFTDLATVAFSGSYIDLSNKPTTVNVNQVDSNTDTSSFTFVNGHIYHLTMYLQGPLMIIDSSASATGYVVAYIGSSSTLARYICRQFVDIQNGRITTDDIRLPIDWKAENISSVSGDNQLHIKVIFNNQSYTFTSTSVYDLTLMGTDLSGA